MDERLPGQISSGRTGQTPRSTSIGARILIPGYPQWSWDQRDRAFLLFGSFTTALTVGCLTWGTSVSLGILSFAFVTHVFSAVDAIRQNAFPGFGRFVPTLTTSAGLGVVFYVPALTMASVYAWPIASEDRPRDGFLVNRWAYRHETPRSGQTVWLGSKRTCRPRIGRVVAGPGQRIEWVAGVFRVDEKVIDKPPFLETDKISELKLTIPAGHAFVTFATNHLPGQGSRSDWEILETDEIYGQAWAKSYPIWERVLLD